jgi:surface polysaccharide O-acyltransferase-like enzyme
MGNPMHAGDGCLPERASFPAAQRLYFLDWIRIGAFCVLVCFHTGLYYGPWEWHVKSPHVGVAVEPLLLLTSPWRMSLLFLVSGAASGILLSKVSQAWFLRERSMRLLVPLVFGMLVVVPPQSFCEVAEKMGYQGSYGQFLQRYLSADPGFCAGAHCLLLPAWNHLWFVAYLWVYTVVLSTIVAIVGRDRIAGAARALAGLLSGWRAMLLPVAALAVARAVLSPRFGDTHALVGDWYNHAVYLPIFLAGALLAQQQRFWNELSRLRFHALALALGSWALLVCLHAVPAHAQHGHHVALAAAGVRSMLQWCAILAVCGFGYRHLNVDAGPRRYLTEAVFCVYIVHQTLIVVMATALKPLHIAPFTEAVVIVILTFVGSLAIFEAVRTLAPLRPLFGISPVRAARPGPALDAAPRPAGGTAK